MTTILIILSSAFVGFLLGVYYQWRKGLDKIREEWGQTLLDFIDKNKKKIDSGEIDINSIK